MLFIKQRFTQLLTMCSIGFLAFCRYLDSCLEVLAVQEEGIKTFSNSSVGI